MNLIPVLIVASLVVVAAIAVSGTADQQADAKFVRKVHFTETVQSDADPGMKGGGYEMAVLLSPNPGTIYVGTITYAASSAVQVMVLHELEDGDDGSQPVWTVDGRTKYALTLLESAESGSVEFAGAALALRSENSFEATASVDGWIRGEPIDMLVKTVMVSTKNSEPELKLARTVLPATLPMHIGLYDGGDVYYVVTDASTADEAEHIEQWQSYAVTESSRLKDATEPALGKMYLFKNGPNGDGIYGHQLEIFSTTPEQPLYSSLRTVIIAEWNKGQKTSVIESEKELLENVMGGRIVLEEPDAVINAPQIKWPAGGLPQVANLTLKDYEKSPYESGSQILSLDEENMTVTFVAHREWAVDGQTAYCIPVAATPKKFAETMGVAGAPASSILANSGSAAEYYEFKNGISGSGPLGYQISIRNGTPGQDDYSPIQKPSLVEWVQPGQARVLATWDDIKTAHESELISIVQARPLNSDHVVNCPIVHPDIVPPAVQKPEANMTKDDENPP